MAATSNIPVASFVGERPDLDGVRRVLLVRLRSIGDTVLMTPCVSAIKRWRPDVEVDVLLEPFCAPLLEGHPEVDRVVTVERSLLSRARVGRSLHANKYDVAVNLNGGTSAAMLAVASGAAIRVGFEGYRSPWLANCRVTSSHHVWQRTDVHTVEHQLALIAGIGIPVTEAGPTSLAVSSAAAEAVAERLTQAGIGARPYAVIHPEASLDTKTWPAERFGQVADHLAETRGMATVTIGKNEGVVHTAAGSTGHAMPDISLAETMALIARAALFVGNDSGPAHIAAAYARPLIVIFGASNKELWRPWSRGSWRIVSAPVASTVCVAETLGAIDEVLAEEAQRA